jgi:hypothetical protein
VKIEEITNNSKDVEKWINLANMAADEGNKEKNPRMPLECSGS